MIRNGRRRRHGCTLPKAVGPRTQVLFKKNNQGKGSIVWNQICLIRGSFGKNNQRRGLSSASLKINNTNNLFNEATIRKVTSGLVLAPFDDTTLIYQKSVFFNNFETLPMCKNARLKMRIINGVIHV